MRSSAKYVFYVLAFTFVGWLAYGQVMDIVAPGANIVLKVNGQEVPIPAYQQAVRAALEQYRLQTGAAPLTREQQREIEDQVVDRMIGDILLEGEYDRLGLQATDDEVRAAARTAPLPEFLSAPDFQTNGQFDPAKYQRFLATAPAETQLAIEARYREEIPRIKLAQYLTADVYVPDGKLWRIYRDQQDSVRIILAEVEPELIPDSAATVTEDDLERYYRTHQDELRRPGLAYLTYVAMDRRPDAADTSAARARVRALLAEVRGAGSAKFAETAKRESADSVSAREGGDLGWVKRGGATFTPPFAQAMRRLRPGQVSEPVATEFGYHLIRVDSARGDSIKVRHILVPVELVGEHLDRVEERADSLDRGAAEQPNPGALDTAAAMLELPLTRAVAVEEQRVVLGRHVIPDVGVWAFEAQAGETSPVIETSAAYYVFRLDSLDPGGTPPLARVREEVRQAVRRERKVELAFARAVELAPRVLQSAEPIPAEERLKLGLAMTSVGPFTRLSPATAVRGEPLVVGAAFGLRVGERTGPIRGARGTYFVELVGRRLADSARWVAQRDAQRDRMLAAAREARVGAYLAELRREAKVVDRRKEIFRTAAQQQPATAPPLF